MNPSSLSPATVAAMQSINSMCFLLCMNTVMGGQENGTSALEMYCSDMPKAACLAAYVKKMAAQKIRPVLNPRTPTNVTFRIALYQLVDVDEVNQNLIMSTWSKQVWQDELVVWNPDDFDSLDEVHINPTEIWRPDTYLYSNLEMDEKYTERLMTASIRTDFEAKRSLITLLYPAIYKFSCHMSVNDFPFDTQICDMIFGSWSFSDAAITYFNVENEPNISMEYFVTNQQWDIISFYHTKESLTAYNNTYSLLIFKCILQRKPLFYCINLVIPSVIVAFINFIGFFTPSNSSGDREEKITLALTTLLAQGVLLLQLADHTPNSSTSVPLVGRFITTQLIMIAVAAILTVIVIQLQHKGECNHPPSKCLMLFLKLTRWVAETRCCGDKSRRGEKLREINQNSDIDYKVGPAAMKSATYFTMIGADDNGYANEPTLDPLSYDEGTIDERPCSVSPLNAIMNNFQWSATRMEQLKKEANEEQDTKIAHETPTERRLLFLCAELHKLQKLVVKVAVREHFSKDEQKSDWILAATALERISLVVFCGSCILMTITFFIYGVYLQQSVYDALHL